LDVINEKSREVSPNKEKSVNKKNKNRKLNPPDLLGNN